MRRWRGHEPCATIPAISAIVACMPYPTCSSSSFDDLVVARRGRYSRCPRVPPGAAKVASSVVLAHAVLSTVAGVGAAYPRWWRRWARRRKRRRGRRRRRRESYPKPAVVAVCAESTKERPICTRASATLSEALSANCSSDGTGAAVFAFPIPRAGRLGILPMLATWDRSLHARVGAQKAAASVWKLRRAGRRRRGGRRR